MMKKFLSMLYVLFLSAALLAGCSFTSAKSAPKPASTSEGKASASEIEASAAEPVDVNIMALKGPTAMGMVQFMSQSDSGALTDNHYNFTIAAAVDEVTPKLVQGEIDIAAVPANLSSVLYNNTKGGIEVLAINTLGILYIVESGGTVASIEDLRGKTIYASGKGATPEYALNYILTKNNIDPAADVNIEWKSEHAECLAALMAEENAIAMLPQPFVTTAQIKSKSIRVALDLNKEWDTLQENNDKPSALITGVVVARREFVERNPGAVSAFMDHYRSSVEFVNTSVAEAAQLAGKYDIVPAAVAEKALPACNITFLDGAKLKEKLSGYLTVLLEQNPAAVGGELPADDFYYAR